MKIKKTVIFMGYGCNNMCLFCCNEDKRLKIRDKTTEEIKKLLGNAQLDFELIEKEALNAYLPRIFQSCPFSEDICTTKQCMNCAVFKDSVKK